MVLHKATIYTLGEVFSRLGKSLAIYLLAYLQTKEQFGIYSYVIAAVGIVVILLDFGLNSLVILRASVQHFRRLFKLVLLVKVLILGAVTGAILALDLVVPLFRNLGVPILVPFIALSISWDLQAFLANALRARLDYNGEALVKVIGSVGFLALLAGLNLVYGPIDAVTALWSQAIVLALSIGIAGWRLWIIRSNFARLGLRPGRGIRAVAAISLPLALSAFGASLFNTVDTLVLGAFSEFSANATFSLVHRIGLLSHLPIGILIGFLLPHLAARFSRSTARPERALVDLLVTGCAIGGVGASQAYLLGIDWIVVPLLGKNYADANQVAPVLALYIIPIYVYSIISTFLIAKRYIVTPQLFFAAATVLSAALDCLVILVLHPLMVAWVSASMNWLLLLSLCVLYRRQIDTWPMSTSTTIFVMISGATVLTLSFGASGTIGTVVRLVFLSGAVALTWWVFWRRKHLLSRVTRHETG